MERKKAYLEHLPETDDSARLVSLADKVHNVRSLVVEYRQAGEALWQRFSASRDDCLWYYYSLLEIFRSLPSSRTAPLVDELNLAIVELQRFTASSEA